MVPPDCGKVSMPLNVIVSDKNFTIFYHAQTSHLFCINCFVHFHIKSEAAEAWPGRRLLIREKRLGEGMCVVLIIISSGKCQLISL